MADTDQLGPALGGVSPTHGTAGCFQGELLALPAGVQEEVEGRGGWPRGPGPVAPCSVDPWTAGEAPG